MNIIINDKPCQGAVGEKLSRIAQDNKAHVGHVCAGLGICQTCYVTVFDGTDCLSPLSDVEIAFLSEKQIDEGARLACQATIVNEGVIRILSRPEEVRRMVLSNPLSLFSYSMEMGKSAAERFVPGVSNVIDRIQKGEMQGQAALDEAFSGMGAALQSSIDAARQSIPFKEQINVMVDFCKQMLPFSDSQQVMEKEESVERLTVTIGEGQNKKNPLDPVPESTSLSSEFEPLGFVVADKLESAGIFTCSELLERGKTSSDRAGLAAESDLSKKEVLTLVNYADLCRINDIDLKRAKLLEVSGVDTVPELAHRNPSNLYDKLVDVNKKSMILEKEPSRQEVEKWVEEAKTHKKVITY